jgi:hypothetical protein
MEISKILNYRKMLPESKVDPKYDYDQIIPGFITKAYDGDTITVKFYQSDRVCEESVRIYGIDTPETVLKKDKSGKYKHDHRRLEELTGRFVRDYVRELVKNCDNRCFIKIHKDDDKYGRLLCSVYLEPNFFEEECPAIGECVDLSDLLMNLKYAKKYHGKTKSIWEQEELLYILGAYEGFHLIEWDVKHKRFSTCLQEVLEHYKDTDQKKKYQATIEKKFSLVNI